MFFDSGVNAAFCGSNIYLSTSARYPLQGKNMLITQSPEKDKSCSHSYKYSTIQQTATEHGQSSYSSPLKMLATETGETSGRTTFRTRPKIGKIHNLHRIGQFQPLQHGGWCINLDYCDVERSALDLYWSHSIILSIYPSTAFPTLLLTMRATPFLLWDSCPQQ